MQYKRPSRLAAGVQMGQPCDAFHMLYRKYQDAYMDCYLGYHSDLANRSDLAFAPRDSSGVVVRSVSIRVNIECNIWAWEQMPTHMFRWAWVSRGLVDVADMALANDVAEAAMFESLEKRPSTTLMHSACEICPLFIRQQCTSSTNISRLVKLNHAGNLPLTPTLPTRTATCGPTFQNCCH